MRMELRRLGMALAFGWLAVGVVSYAAAVVFARIDGSSSAMPPIRWTLLALVTRAACIPLFIVLMRKVPIVRERILRGLLLHACFCLALAAIHLLVYLGIRMAVEEIVFPHFIRLVLTFTKYAVLNYAVVGAAVAALHQQRLVRLTTLIRTRLERRLAAARLERELLSIDAEGIVRSLDQIERRIEREPAEAERMIAALSNRLRRKLRHARALASGAFSAAPPLSRQPWSQRQATLLAFAVYPVAAVCWSVLTIAQGWFSPRAADPVELTGSLLGFTISAATWPIILFVSRKFQPVPEDWRRGMLVAAACSFGSGVVTETTIALLRLIGIGPEAGRALGPALFVSFIAASLLQSARYGEWRASEHLRTERVLRDVKQAQLRTLRKQLAPHFLFNALNSILCLLETDRSASRTMLAKLRRVLQLTFWHHSQEEVALSQDLELTSSYVEIERVRFRDALDLTIDVDRDLLGAAVPSFLLQPLVENAVRHGALSSRGRGTIELHVHRTGAGMEIRVDNDCDLIESHEYREGIGLANIRQRLRHLYGTDQQLSVDGHGRGFSVRIRLPIRVCADAA